MAASGIVSRPRIEQLLAGAWERRITLTVAGGGYGKTTALRQLAASRPASWLALTAADRETEVLSAHVAAAIGLASDRGVADTAAAIGASDRQSLAEGQAAAICERLDARDVPTMLVLDEVEHLSDDDSASRFLSALCLQAPTQLHIVLSGRWLPGLRLGTATGRGELLELTAPDLAFTAEETAALLVARFGPVAKPLAQECWSLTTGWAAALQLIADRLERLEPGAWYEALAELRLHRGRMWRDFAADLVEREPPAARRVLELASVAPAVDPQLLAGVGLGAATDELDSLQNRGLLVASGRSTRTLSPVLSEVVAERLPPSEVDELRRRTTAWLEQSGRLKEALECAMGGSPDEALSLLRRRGRTLVAGGYGARVAEILGDLGTGRDLHLDTIRGEALVSVGDWDGAMEVFGAIQRRTAGAPLDASTAWRFGALLYLRGELEDAQEVLAGAFRNLPGTADDALVSAWLSSNLWGQGNVEQAEAKAEVALRQAEASGDPGARAAAHVATALCAASRGDRERNERHYRLALNAAAEAGDSVQLARIHANLSSRAVEEGDYRGAIDQADEALSAGAGHNLYGAIAMSNKAEALLHTGALEEARALLVRTIELFSSLGSLMASTPYTLLGALEAERGDLVRARVALERAWRLAEEGGDVHSVVLALSTLAAVLAQDDPETARRHATEAAKRATGLERAHALCVASWVELCADDRTAAARLSAEAEAEARRTGDRPSLARALELRAVVRQPPDQAQLEAAAELWREVGDPIAQRRAELMLACCRADSHRVQSLRDELSRAGVSPDIGVSGLLLAQVHQAPEVAIVTLGRFAVLRAGQPIPLAAWQSRKARDLLKLLASRRGRPITREAVVEALWPGEDPRPLSNRLSVALSTLRKVIDPERAHPPDHFIASDHQSLALRIEHLNLDVISFLNTEAVAVSLASEGNWATAEAKLRQADSLYTGDFLAEDLYEDWPVDCREEARSAAQEVSRLLARAATLRDDDEEATRHLRRLLERDPYDADAWTALLAAQLRLRRYGEARRQHAIYARRMSELDVPPVPLARIADS